MVTLNFLIGFWALDPVDKLLLMFRDTDIVICTRDKSDRNMLNVLQRDKLTDRLTLKPLVKGHELLESVNQGILLFVLI